jgi:hypothetical protein
VQDPTGERLRQTGDHVLVAATQMPELRERTVEMPLPDVVGTGVERRDHGRGLAGHPFPHETSGRQPGGLFALGDDVGRYGHLGSQIVDTPIAQAIQWTGVRGDASRHGDIDDDEVPARESRPEQVDCEYRAARVSGRYDAIGRVQSLGDVFERDGLTIGDGRRLQRALTRAAHDENPSDTASKSARGELADLSRSHHEDRRAGRLAKFSEQFFDGERADRPTDGTEPRSSAEKPAVMQGAFDRRREQRRERIRSIDVRPPELTEDLALTRNRGIETRGDAEEMRDCGGIRPHR